MAEGIAVFNAEDRRREIDRRLHAYWTEHLELPWRLFKIFGVLALLCGLAAWQLWTPFVLGVLAFGFLTILSHAWYMHYRLKQIRIGRELLQELDST